MTKIRKIISEKEPQLEAIKTESLAVQIKLNKAEKEMLDHSAATKEREYKLTTEITEASMTKKFLEKNISGLEKRIDKLNKIVDNLQASKNDLKIDRDKLELSSAKLRVSLS